MTTTTTNFKLIGILTGKKPDESQLKSGWVNRLKILKEETFYPFYASFSYDEKRHMLSYDPSETVDLYSLKGSEIGRHDDLKIHISAIVGKNGSGKSTLLELLYIAVYNISVAAEVIHDPETEELIIGIHERYALDIELFFQVGEEVWRVVVNGLSKTVRLESLTLAPEIPLKKTEEANPISRKKMEQLCYSIVINYSIYGLNARHIGKWINALFHKNDAYQTPLVINPMRHNGNFDINREEHLAKSRLLVNLLRKAPYNSLIDAISDNQRVDQLTFKLNRNKVDLVYRDGKSVAFNYEHFYRQHSEDGTNVEDGEKWLFTQIFRFLFDDEIMEDDNVLTMYSHVPHYAYAKKYIIRKLLKIAKVYQGYDYPLHQLRIEHENPETGTHYFGFIDLFYKETFCDYLKKLAEDKSHITFKLKQAVNYLKFNPLTDRIDLQEDQKEDIPQSGKWYGEPHPDPLNWLNIDEEKRNVPHYSINVLDLANFLQPEEDLNDPLKVALLKEDLINLLPPSLFDLELSLKPHTDQKESMRENDTPVFSALSSGEQQSIHSVQSILYHLRNLDSVFDQPEPEQKDKKRLQYENVCIILDEIELYFHPDLQRKFIYDLLKGIKRIRLRNIKGINILFATHSPFILSDIPNQNILRLKNGAPEAYDPNQRTFGANVHEQLADSFFMESTMGCFAEGEIRGLIAFYEKVRQASDMETLQQLKIIYDLQRSAFKNLSKLIGESVIRGIVQNHIQFIDERLGYMSDRLEVLEREKKRIDEEITKLKNDDKNKLS